MASGGRFEKRIARDLQQVQEWCRANGREFADDGPRAFTVDVAGPADTPYAGGMFVVRCELPVDYPLKSPSVCFRTMVWHPNVQCPGGSVCLDVLNAKWSTSTPLVQVFDIYLPYLLAHPNSEDPNNRTAADMMLACSDDFAAYTVIHTQKHARGPWRKENAGDPCVVLPSLAGVYTDPDAVMWAAG